MNTVSRPGAAGPQRLIRRYASGRLYDTVHRRLVSLPAIRIPTWLEDVPTHPCDDAATSAGACTMSVARRACEAVVVVSVHGRLDADGSATVDHRLQQILTAGNLSALVVDLSRVSYLDDDGVRTLQRSADTARETGTRFRLVTGDGAASRRLGESDVRPSLPTAPGVDSACSEVFAPGFRHHPR